MSPAVKYMSGVVRMMIAVAPVAPRMPDDHELRSRVEFRAVFGSLHLLRRSC